MLLDSDKPKIRCLEEQEKYGKFVVEPLERGYGTTLGTALRRVMLTSIRGPAITAVSISGVLHEFSTIPGIMEDVTDILLNLKELAIRTTVGPLTETKTGRVQARGKGEVTGADLQLPPELEVVTAEQHIATLTSDNAALSAELTVQEGTGYLPAEKQKRSEMPIGVIPVDAVFTPVRRVNLYVEPTRVGHQTDLDRLILEIWTNGTVQPSAAISQAAKILDRHLQIFFDFAEREAAEKRGVEDEVRERDRVLAYRIEELDFSVRTYNCLQRASVETLADLVQMTEDRLMQIRNFGKKSLNEVKEKLASLSLVLREAVEPQAAEIPAEMESEGLTFEEEEDDGLM